MLLSRYLRQVVDSFKKLKNRVFVSQEPVLISYLKKLPSSFSLAGEFVKYYRTLIAYLVVPNYEYMLTH